MSVHSFMRELSSTTSARSVLMSQYRNGLTSGGDVTSECSGDRASLLSSTDSDCSDVCTKQSTCHDGDGDDSLMSSIFEPFSKCSHIALIGSGSLAADRTIRNMTPEELASPKSAISRELLKKFNDAGTRIFTAAMILSYRRQREQIRKLLQDNDDLRRKCWKYDQQVYVYQKLYDDEKERNYELQNKLRARQNKAAQTRAKRDSLKESVEKLKAANELLEKQLHAQAEQFEGLQISFAEVQSSLFQTMARERELQRQLCEEQRRVRALIVNESDLVLQLHSYKQHADDKKKNLWTQLKCKQAVLARYKQDKEALTTQLCELLVKTEFETMGTELQNSMNEISQIRQNLQSLRQQLEDSWSNRLRRFWLESSTLRLRFAEFFLVVGFCVVPNVHVAHTSIYAKIPLRAISYNFLG